MKEMKANDETNSVQGSENGIPEDCVVSPKNKMKPHKCQRWNKNCKKSFIVNHMAKNVVYNMLCRLTS